MATNNNIQQISLALTSEAGIVIPAGSASEEQRKEHLALIRQAALDVHPDWPIDIHLRQCHSIIYVPPSHVETVEKLQNALSKALTSIVDRWWSDKDADFPNQMPVNQHEEDVLKWIAGPGKHLVPSYQDHQGCWRPDYLIESRLDANGNPTEQIRICEINARFPYNGFLISTFGSRAYAKLGHQKDFNFTADPEEVLTSLLALFDHSLPLHIVMDQWPGVDVHMFASCFRQRTGQAATFIEPSSLRLVPNHNSGTGYLLYRVIDASDQENQSRSLVIENGESLERVYQVSLELMQSELEALSGDLLKQIATCCVNDLRTTLLVHDKRMLGVVLSDLNNLVNKNILTPEEADTISQGITPTILPRSNSLKAFVSSCEADTVLKNSYVLKAIRGGFGQGHIFGSDVENDAWLDKLRGLRDADLSLDQNSYAVQRRIIQVEYDIFRPQVEVLERFHLVSSYMALNGRYLGLAVWRLGRKLHISLNDEQGGVIMVAVTDTEF